MFVRDGGPIQDWRNMHRHVIMNSTLKVAIESYYRREALEIRLQGIAPIANRDRGNIMKSESWNAILLKLNKKL